MGNFSQHNAPVKISCGLSFLSAVCCALLVLTGCDSGSGGGDQTPPTVSITQPTGSGTYTTSRTSITIKGTATDNQSVEQVSWKNSRGGSGTARGTSSWEAEVPLSAGENVITVTATDPAGNTGSDTLTAISTEETYTLSGTITPSANAAIDSDVNDPNATYKSNDTMVEAQELPAPVTLGGYVNQPGTGEKGRSYSAGDVDDVFLVDLPAGEHIVLNIANPAAEADLDLYLYDHANPSEPIDASVNVARRTESLTVPQAGKYFIHVYAYEGASNYNLTIGQSDAVNARTGLRLSRDFVPGEAIVELGRTSRSRAKAADTLSALGISRKAGAPGRAGLFSTLQTGDGDFFIQSEKQKPFSNPLLSAASMPWRTREKLETLYALKSLRSRPDVARAEPNHIRKAFKTPNDPKFWLQWHYPLINLPEAWEIATGSRDVRVAVFDTGILMEHPDLRANISDMSYDFISDPRRAMDGDGIDADAGDPGDQSPGGSTFHGSHVAGTIAAVTDNNTGAAGVTWNSRIMAIRVLGRHTSGTSYDIIQGVRYAAGLENDSGTIPDKPADIINLSLGGSSYSAAEQEIYTRARNRGIIIIAAAGNSGENAPSYPAAYDGVISVSAVGINARIAPYSNFGDTVDVAAPGGDASTDLNGDGYTDGILSTSGDDSSGAIEHVYRFEQGTSMAAPHMAGVAALMKSLRPGMTPDELDAWLLDGSIVRDIGEPGRDDLYGHGLIDAYKAVRTAQNGSSPTVLNVNPASLNFGSTTSAAYLTASRLGEDSLHITSVSANADWLSVNASGTDANGLGTYTVTVNREGLPDGTYSALITFVSTSNTIEVPVNMRIRELSDLAPDAGLQYILLVDHSIDETVDQFMAPTRNGAYEFRFTDVDPGRYRIYSGTDLDNDFSIGDAGEAIGAYRSTNQPVVLDIDSDRSGLDFVTEFNVDIRENETSQSLRRLPADKQTPLKEVTR